MLRHSKFEPEEIEREKGVIVEEMNMYYDTPRDYVDGVYDELLYGDQPLGWDIIGTKDTVRAATRETFLGYLDRWYRGAPYGRRRLGRGGERRGRPCLRTCSATSRTARPAPSTRRMGAGRAAGQDPHEDLRPGARAHGRAQLSDRPSGPVLAHAPRDRSRRRDVVTALHRGAGAARPRLLHLRHNQAYTDAGTLFAQGGVDINRIDDAVATIVGEFGRIAAEPLERDELEKARNFAKGRLVLSLEDPKGMIAFALRDEVLEGKLREPDEVLAALDKVTVEDVHRVAQDIVRQDRLNLALIGPFDEPERFQKLLELEVAA